MYDYDLHLVGGRLEPIQHRANLLQLLRSLEKGKWIVYGETIYPPHAILKVVKSKHVRGV